MTPNNSSEHLEKTSNNSSEGKNFYWKGRYFNTLEDMKDFAKKWPDMPCDIEEFRKFLDARYEEALLNKHLNGDRFTNRHAYYMLQEPRS